MTLLHVGPQSAQLLAEPPSALPAEGFVWCAVQRASLTEGMDGLMDHLARWKGSVPLELHQKDLRNAQHPSHCDDTRDYDLLIFRQLTLEPTPETTPLSTPTPQPTGRRGGPPILQRLGTQPVGFLLYDGFLLSVHGEHCSLRADMQRRLLEANHSRLPVSADDLMLRMISLMVDRFLDLRKPLTEQLDHWQAELLNPHTRFVNWRALLSARHNLHALEDLCDGQRSAVQQWRMNLEQTRPEDTPLTPQERSDREVLRARSRDVIEHIDRVVHHVQRLAQNTETAVQMHFSAQSHRTNEIMKTLTAVTAVFLPLNLITGFFGMNFEFLPLIHHTSGLWWAVGTMVTVAVALAGLFWRKRYLARSAN